MRGLASQFAHERRLIGLAGLWAGLAWALALVYLAGSPTRGMRPLVVAFGDLWWRYSLIGDLALIYLFFRYRDLFLPGLERVLGHLLWILALWHGLSSWHDPWGAVYSNTLVEWLILGVGFGLGLSWARAYRQAFPRVLLGLGLGLVVLVGVVSFLTHYLFLVSLVARRLIVKLFAIVGGSVFYPALRFGLAFSALLLILVLLWYRLKRFEQRRSG